MIAEQVNRASAIVLSAAKRKDIFNNATACAGDDWKRIDVSRISL